jgi:hypothetical protein
MPTRSRALAAVVVVAFAAACGGSTEVAPGVGAGGSSTNAAGGAGTTSAHGGAGGSSTTPSAGGSSTTSAQGGAGGSQPAGGAGGAPVPPDCDAIVADLASSIVAPGACTAVVRLAHETKAPLGFALVCGKYAKVDEATARATAQADTGYGASGKALSPPFPGEPDELVFYQAPMDFGGVAAVSADTGLSVFGGSVVWGGLGEIAYPHAFRPVSELGVGCAPPAAAPPKVRGFDLSIGDGAALSAADAKAAFDVAWSTAIPAAFATRLYFRDSMVLLYPRTVGLFDPKTAEDVVLFNGYWLE